jgi:hypothetical protein
MVCYTAYSIDCTYTLAGLLLVAGQSSLVNMGKHSRINDELSADVDAQDEAFRKSKKEKKDRKRAREETVLEEQDNEDKEIEIGHDDKHVGALYGVRGHDDQTGADDDAYAQKKARKEARRQRRRERAEEQHAEREDRGVDRVDVLRERSVNVEEEVDGSDREAGKKRRKKSKRETVEEINTGSAAPPTPTKLWGNASLGE